MADATTASDSPSDIAPEVKIDAVGPAMKRLTITIPPEAIAEKLEESIGALTHEAVLPGFRKGRAPRRLLEKRFGDSVKDETKKQLIADAYSKAIEEHSIQPVGDPEPVESPDDLTLELGRPMTFSVDVEVVPEFDLPALDGIEIKKPLLEITEEHLDDRIALHTQRMGTIRSVDSDFQEGDRLLGHVVVTKEGESEPLHTEDDAVIICPGGEAGGQGPVLGIMIDGLAGKFKGKRIGDTLEIEAVGPDAYEREDVRGAKLTIAYRITAAERIEPATREELVEAFGAGTEENLRQQLRLALEHRRDQEQAAAMREQVHKYLLDSVDFELPAKLTAAQAARTVEVRRLELLERGLPPAAVEANLAKLRSRSEQETHNQLKLFFLLHSLARHYDVEVSEQEVNGRVAAIAVEHGQRPDQLRAELARSGRLNEVARMVRDQKAADRVVAQAKVSEISAEEWAKLMGGPAPAKKKTTKKKTTKKKTSKK